MNIKIISKNPLKSIVDKMEIESDGKVYSYAKVKEDGNIRTIYVGTRPIKKIRRKLK